MIPELVKIQAAQRRVEMAEELEGLHTFADFDESKHLRKGGKFASKGGSEKEAAMIATVANPESPEEHTEVAMDQTSNAAQASASVGKGKTLQEKISSHKQAGDFHLEAAAAHRAAAKANASNKELARGHELTAEGHAEMAKGHHRMAGHTPIAEPEESVSEILDREPESVSEILDREANRHRFREK